MSLAIEGTVRDGAARLFSRTGAVLIAAYVSLMVVYQLSINGLLASFLHSVPSASEASMNVGATYPAPTAVYGAVTLVSLVLMSAFTVVAVRTFVAGATDRIPREFYTRRMAWTTVNVIVGGFAFGLIVLVGTILLVIPGIVAYVGLVFMTMFIAVEDENFVTALRHSWRVVRPEFVGVFLLLLVLVIGLGLVSAVLAFALSLGTAALGFEGWSGVVVGVVTAPLSLFILAILSAAFDRLRGDGVAGRTAMG